MPIDWSPFVDLVRKHQRFLITTHVRPDPDGLGSQLALADVLEGMGRKVQTVIASAWPPRYTFLDPERRIERFAPPGDAHKDVEVIVVLDTGTWNQLGDFGDWMKTSAAKKVVIDHHVTQDGLGGLLLADTSAEATGRLVYDAARALGQQLSRKAASCLFAAVATDTGWFRHKNTTPATFALAEKLTQAGADPTYLYDAIYEQNTAPRVNLLGLVLQRMQVVENGKVAYSEVCKDDYARTGAIPQDTEDAVGYTRSIAGVEVGLLFLEQPAGGIKVSFRSKGVDVAAIAAQFGGGGHKLASGATLQTTLAEAKQRVLDAVRTGLTKGK
ncbi:MAG: bifunctional oligoribonuclease/PAP phosphatase NrnA [Planctomycetes bacterium]|nr:bifunctional oligoribonuclease/PAP phosphatase NrnA [Planctomycetota bacterium]